MSHVPFRGKDERRQAVIIVFDLNVGQGLHRTQYERMSTYLFDVTYLEQALQDLRIPKFGIT